MEIHNNPAWHENQLAVFVGGKLVGYVADWTMSRDVMTFSGRMRLTLELFNPMSVDELFASPVGTSPAVEAADFRKIVV